jgi:uncharacterized membrane protein YdjX (TVP38/TMEM64 family)
MNGGGASPARSRAWLAAAGTLAAVGLGWWLATAGRPAFQLLVELYRDRDFLEDCLQQAGVWAPVIFIGIQALQVVVSPIPGEVIGFLGGYLFGEALGFVYSTIGLTIGTLASFGIGRWLGSAFVRRIVSPRTWERVGFLARTEGAILCLVIYLLPGFPKDIVSYLFGVAPISFWVFAALSTVGRLPGTWVLSTQGAKTASGHYTELAVLTAVVVIVGLPLYLCRDRIMARLRTPGPVVEARRKDKAAP